MSRPGDGGEAARRAQILRPSMKVRLSAELRAVLGLVAARRQCDLNTLVLELIMTGLETIYFKKEPT
jgi:predicted HicB family RNase H-like nuclease